MLINLSQLPDQISYSVVNVLPLVEKRPIIWTLIYTAIQSKKRPLVFKIRLFAAASVAGFVDGMGYIGAALTGVASGFLADRFGWNAAFYLWMAGALGAAILMLLIWNYRPKPAEYH